MEIAFNGMSFHCLENPFQYDYCYIGNEFQSKLKTSIRSTPITLSTVTDVYCQSSITVSTFNQPQPCLFGFLVFPWNPQAGPVIRPETISCFHFQPTSAGLTVISVISTNRTQFFSTRINLRKTPTQSNQTLQKWLYSPFHHFGRGLATQLRSLASSRHRCHHFAAPLGRLSS